MDSSPQNWSFTHPHFFGHIIIIIIILPYNEINNVVLNPIDFHYMKKNNKTKHIP